MTPTIQKQKIKVDNTEITLYDVGTDEKYLSIFELGGIIPKVDIFIPEKDKVSLCTNKSEKEKFISLKTFERILISNSFSQIADTKLLRNIYNKLYANPFKNIQKNQTVVKVSHPTSSQKKQETTNDFSFYGFISLRTRYKNNDLGVTKKASKYLAEGKEFDTEKEAAIYYDDLKFKKYGERSIPYLNYPTRYKKEEKIQQEKTTKELLDDNVVVRSVKFDFQIWQDVLLAARVYETSSEDIIETALESFFWSNRLNIIKLDKKGIST